MNKENSQKTPFDKSIEIKIFSLNLKLIIDDILNEREENENFDSIQF